MFATRENIPHQTYRPDIDGLRAIAILSVLAYHAFPEWVRGGFIGVDIFFVISGYLISKIILENLNCESFSLADFYCRRIRRIFPALILVLAASYALGWGTLMTNEYLQLATHITAGAGFFSNFSLWNEVGYFDNLAETKPLLHLWSLSIEEQFYLVWPLLLGAIWHRGRLVPVLMAMIAFSSFLFGIHELSENSAGAFFSPFSRAWELMCGGLLSWADLNRMKLSRYRSLFPQEPTETSTACSNFGSALGILLLLCGLLLLGGSNFHYPGAWALIPVAGATLIIASGPLAWSNRWILSSPILVGIGAISYPLYLWHWPLLSIVRIANGSPPSTAVRLGLLTLSFILAWLTYQLIERPIRRGIPSRLKVYILALSMGVIAYIGFNTFERAGLPFRSVVKINTILASGYDGDTQNNSTSGCGVPNQEARKLIPKCEHDTRGNVRYALLGDSKAESLYPGLVRTSSNEARWEIVGGNGPYGSPIPLISNDAELRSDQPGILVAVDTILGNPQIETIVIASAMRNIFHLKYHENYMKDLPNSLFYDKALSGFSETVSRFSRAGKKVVIVIDNPALPEPGDCVVRKASWNIVNPLIDQERGKCFIPQAVFVQETFLYRKLLQTLKARFPDSVDIFDPTAIYCDARIAVCGPFQNGRLLYSRTDHISDYAAGLVGQELNKFLRQSPSQRSSPGKKTHQETQVTRN